MDMTEDDARMRCCVRLAPGGAAPPMAGGGCVASACMAWRWQPLMADTAFLEAVRKAADELGDKAPARPKATAHVMANRAKYGLPVEPFLGHCGLAGKPLT